MFSVSSYFTVSVKVTLIFLQSMTCPIFYVHIDYRYTCTVYVVRSQKLYNLNAYAIFCLYASNAFVPAVGIFLFNMALLSLYLITFQYSVFTLCNILYNLRHRTIFIQFLVHKRNDFVTRHSLKVL